VSVLLPSFTANASVSVALADRHNLSGKDATIASKFKVVIV